MNACCTSQLACSDEWKASNVAWKSTQLFHSKPCPKSRHHGTQLSSKLCACPRNHIVWSLIEFEAYIFVLINATALVEVVWTSCRRQVFDHVECAFPKNCYDLFWTIFVDLRFLRWNFLANTQWFANVALWSHRLAVTVAQIVTPEWFVALIAIFLNLHSVEGEVCLNLTGLVIEKMKRREIFKGKFDYWWKKLRVEIFVGLTL